jgi:hypothetical protein
MFPTFSTAGADSRAAHPLPGADTRLITASLDGRIQSHDRPIVRLEKSVDRLHQAPIECEWAKVSKAAKDVDLAAEQPRALAHGTLAHEDDVEGFGEVIAAFVRRRMQGVSDWKSAIGEVRKRAKDEEGTVSGQKEVIGAVEGERLNLQKAIATSWTELKEDFVSIEGEAKDSQRQWREGNALAIADVRKGVALPGAQLQAVIEEDSRRGLAGAKTRRAKGQQGAKVGELKLWAEMHDQDNGGLSKVKELRPQGQKGPLLSSDLGGLIAVVGLRGGSRVTGALSAWGLVNVAVRDWSDNFAFRVGDHRYRCRSSAAQFLSPRVSRLQSSDATIDELRREVEDRDYLFGSVLEVTGGGGIAVDLALQRTFAGMCSALWNSELYQSFYPELGDDITMENVFDRLEFLSATRCDISTELEFIASHFCDLSSRRDSLKALPFSMIYEILCHRSLRLDSEDSLYDFINKSTEANREMFGLLEFVRLEYCSTDVINEFLDVLAKDLHEINASMWASFRARLVLPNKTLKQFLPSVQKGKLRVFGVSPTSVMYDIPDGIIAYLTTECSGNVHDCHIIDITSGSFEKETNGASPPMVAPPDCALKNAIDFESTSHFASSCRYNFEGIPHTRNNWVCYDFKARRIVPPHYAIRPNNAGSGANHLNSWPVETSADRKSWREVDHQENNAQLNGWHFTGTFPVAGGGECRFIRLVNIGRNHCRNDQLRISDWGIFGGLIE